MQQEFNVSNIFENFVISKKTWPVSGLPDQVSCISMRIGSEPYDLWIVLKSRTKKRSIFLCFYHYRNDYLLGFLMYDHIWIFVPKRSIFLVSSPSPRKVHILHFVLPPYFSRATPMSSQTNLDKLPRENPNTRASSRARADVDEPLHSMHWMHRKKANEDATQEVEFYRVICEKMCQNSEFVRCFGTFRRPRQQYIKHQPPFF